MGWRGGEARPSRPHKPEMDWVLYCDNCRPSSVHRYAISWIFEVPRLLLHFGGVGGKEGRGGEVRLKGVRVRVFQGPLPRVECHRPPLASGSALGARPAVGEAIPPGRHEHAKQRKDIIKTFPAERDARPRPHAQPSPLLPLVLEVRLGGHGCRVGVCAVSLNCSVCL